MGMFSMFVLAVVEVAIGIVIYPIRIFTGAIIGFVLLPVRIFSVETADDIETSIEVELWFWWDNRDSVFNHDREELTKSEDEIVDSKHIVTKRSTQNNSSALHRKNDNYENELNTDPLKMKGDAYEKFIGSKLENKGELVIYNGLIRGMNDRGVDIISLSSREEVINLVQCKNWSNMKMEFSHIQEIHLKLTLYTNDFQQLNAQTINKYLKHKKDLAEIEKMVEYAKHYTKIRKTLYVASEKVVNPEIGKHLKMIKPNIFRYEDMKIVFVSIDQVYNGMDDK